MLPDVVFSVPDGTLVFLLQASIKAWTLMYELSSLLEIPVIYEHWTLNGHNESFHVAIGTVQLSEQERTKSNVYKYVACPCSVFLHWRRIRRTREGVVPS
jgi:hypothetical protein